VAQREKNVLAVGNFPVMLAVSQDTLIYAKDVIQLLRKALFNLID
tara:strand:+ start:24 stop:158 length:135 start_codon:yes stop_codon:yes gene_type:complete